MKLTSVEIYGFKSFPQRTDIRFDEGITGIVGPNGSGKSNIADAVRWVLGEQSAKALRGAKMEDVIFAGTQKRRLMPYCEVSLVFDNADGQLKNPQSEVMVTRRAYRTGEGEYSLNRKSCRLKDIVELFHDTGIGREGYSIIGQGHIDVILSGRGEERRAAFEEAAGIIGYRARKEEAERKLDRTQEHLLRVGDLLEELGSRLEPLKEQSEAARDYLRLGERLRRLDANIYLNRHERLSRRVAQLKEAQREIGALLAGQEAEIALIKARRAEAEAALAALETEGDALHERLRAAEGALRDQAVLVERGAQGLLSAREELARNREAVQALNGELAQLKTLLTGSQTDSEAGRRLLEEADALLATLETQAGAAFATLQEAGEALENHRGRMLAAINSRSDARERSARQQAMLEQAVSRRSELSRGEPALQDALSLAEQALAMTGERLAQTRGKVSDLGLTLAREEQALALERQTARDAANSLAQAQQAFETDRARHEALLDLARAHEGFLQPVRQALLYGQGKPGVHGAVAHLMSVPKELETAVEMVLGASLQHIVTQDEEAARDLIEYLRDKRYGRATFLPLSAVRARGLNQEERRVLHLPGCIGLASELVQCEAQYRDILGSLLGRTVVADTLDHAIAISRAGRQAFHVVTLQGDVLRAGGAMTGGSIQSRTVSLLGRERELKDLKEALLRHADTVRGLQAALQAAEQAALSREQALLSLRLKVQDEEIGIAREEEQHKQAQERRHQAGERLAQAQAALAQLSEMADELRQDLQKTAEQDRTMDQGQEELAAQETSLKAALAAAREGEESARQVFEAQKDARTQLAHRLDLLTRDSQRLEREEGAALLKLERLIKTGKTLEERIAQDTSRQAALEGKAASLQQSAEALRALSEQTDARRRGLTASQKGLADESERLHAQQAEDSQRLHKSELSLTRHEEELQAMAATLWNTHELTYALAEDLREQERFDLPGSEAEAQDIRRQIKEMGAINLRAVEEYAKAKERYDSLSAQREDATRAREDLQGLIRRLQSQMEKQFIREFALLSEYFSETFKRLFNGGQASLSLADPSQPLSCEIQIKAQPPGKKLQLLSLLSGGERTLTAIAILFAMLKLKPTPFCVLDEIEAALDDANIDSFAAYLAEYAKSTQFIVITHRKGTMERCDTLYGVTMREKGVSDMISVNLQEYTA